MIASLKGRENQGRSRVAVFPKHLLYKEHVEQSRGFHASLIHSGVKRLGVRGLASLVFAVVRL
jgi:hypothetical protein